MTTQLVVSSVEVAAVALLRIYPFLSLASGQRRLQRGLGQMLSLSIPVSVDPFLSKGLSLLEPRG